MGIYDGFSDTPNQIRSEGQQIDLAFIRNGDGSGTIKWNIPMPVAGCSAEDQAYDGIVIVVSSKPANYIDSSPKDGVYYNPDPTFSPDLFTGDTIDEARVVGAFYHDKTTRTLIVQDVLGKTPYYVSAYAVDGVGRYHREGVHAYSLDTGSLEYNSAGDQPARHDIGIDQIPINNGTLTGLISGVDYAFRMNINGEEYTINIEGHDALTYPDLEDAINRQFVLLTDAERINLASLDQYYFNEDTNKLYRWEYNTYVEIPIIVSPDDPSVPVSGTYWYDGTDLYVYESGGWTVVPLFSISYDPVNPPCGAIWFDGIDIWMWSGNKWCKLYTYNQTTNPLLPPTMSCDHFWFDENASILYRWRIDIKGWVEVDAIYTPDDPNTIGPGDYWYDSTNEKMMERFTGSIWNEVANIEYLESNAVGDLDTSTANQFWYDPSTQIFNKRNSSNTAWIELEYTLAATDPTDRKSCDLWWNSSPSVNDLYSWDIINSSWVLAGSFVQGIVDPSSPPELEENSAWYNPETGKIQILTSPDCLFKDVEYITYPTDPTQIGYGIGWLDADGNFKISDGIGGWIDIDPIQFATDPYDITTGTFWYDSTNKLVKVWNGTQWVVVPVLAAIVLPEIGKLILNDVDEKLYMWDGTTWVLANPIAGVELINPNKANYINKLAFFTYATGCTQSIYLITEAGNLFTQLSSTVRYYYAVDGTSRVEKGPTWSALGIGDDGSPDERRALHTVIRERLGHPTQKVELTDDQIDEALNAALGMLRKFSGYGYHRNYFFLDLKPNQQKYILSNQCIGFNKITSINYLYRMRSGFLTGMGRGSADVYGYAALLHLYRTGTFDMLSYHLVSSYIEDMQILFADHITFNWKENLRQLEIYHTVYDHERVLLDAYIERTEQELFTDRETREWIKRWAIAESKMMLSQIRGKFQTLPGPNGSTTLNSQELITQAETEKADLLVELEDRSMQNLEEAGQGATFIMG
jgi:hypothetical protein